MRKFVCLCLTAVLLVGTLSVFSLSASAASLPGKVTYQGTEYFDVTKKADYFNVVQYAFQNLQEHTYVCFKDGQQDYDESYRNNVTNFTDMDTKTIFRYAEYSPNTVCFTGKWFDPENTTEYIFGTLDIEFSDSAEELKKADAILAQDLSGIKNKTDKEKVTFVADYVCSKTEYGFTEMPGGVGPMTIAMLLKNTVTGAKQQNGPI